MPSNYIAKGTIGRNQFTGKPKKSIIYVIGPSIAYVPLTKGMFSVIECDDITKVEMHNWFATWSGTTKSFYAVRMAAPVDGKRVRVFMHHELCGDFGKEVDHRSRCTLDNRRQGNLRHATLSQQSCNRRSRNMLGLKGVVRYSENKYRARIRVSGKLMHLGYFRTAEAAHEAYKKAAVTYFGSYACFDTELPIFTLDG